MVRKKNATFAGVPIMDTDVAAPTFKRDIANIAGDVALIYDKATGSNGEAGIIVHDGEEGALLGIPIINHYIDRSLVLEAHDGAGKSGGVGETWIYAVPFHLADGETQLIVEMSAMITAAIRPYAKVCTTANVEVTREEMTADVGVDGEDDIFFRATLRGLTAGWNLLFIVVDTTNIDDVSDGVELGHLHYVRARPRLRSDRLGGPGSFRETGRAQGPRDAGADLYGVSTPAATEGVVHTSFESTLFADLESVDGYWGSRENRNLTGLEEYIRDSPAGGNQTYVLEDQDGGGAADDTNPARVRAEAHSQAIYDGGGGRGTEGQIDFPVWCEGFGAAIDGGYYAVDEAEPPTKGMLSWYAPWPKVAAEKTIRSQCFSVPDFQSGASRLQCAVLFVSTNEVGADPTQWTIKAKTSTGNSTAAPADTDGAQTLWLALITAIPFTGDRKELVEVTMARAGAKPGGTPGRGEIAVLGAALAFVKP